MIVPETRLVVALPPQGKDEALLRYADRLMSWNRRPIALPAGHKAGPRGDAGDVGSVAVDYSIDLDVSVPQVVEVVRLDSRRALAQLLHLSATSGTSALLVGEGLGRPCLRRLIQRAACSVWFVPDGTPPRIDRILTPVDFSIRAADCLRTATTLARLSHAQYCLALHVYFNDSPLADPDWDRRIRCGIAEDYARFVGPIDRLGVPVRPLFRECSRVATAVHETAEEHDANLIVLSTRGRTRLGALLRPSVAEQTCSLCRVPLLVLKHFGPRLGLLRLLRESGSDLGNSVRFN